MHFVGVDGEAINGKYCFLQDSEGGELFNSDGIGTRQGFEWFLRRTVALHLLSPCFVAFVSTYDINMLFRDVDDDTLKKIFATDDKDFVKWNEYEILYIPRKIFKLRRKGERDDYFSFTLYDVFTFFGTSFVQACMGFLGRVPKEIEKGKKQRATFKLRDLSRIRRYNKLEVEWLVKLCDKLNEIFTSQGMTIKKWHGPGAVAEYVLGKKMLNVHTEYPIYRESEVPIGLFQAWDCSYYGGRFENMGIGSFANVFTYDLNSAYPKALSELCVLDYGTRWIRVTKPRDTGYGSQAVFLVEWKFSDEHAFAPFPWRDSQGRIFYPLNGLGWYWEPEVSAVLSNPRLRRGIKLHEVWYQPTGSPSIFQREIPRFYELRNRLKKEGNPGEYAIKIALNSIYGKLAQRVGRSPFRCTPWAGWITSYTRSLLLRATMGRENDVLAFATDSIFSKKPLSVPCGSLLGQWKEEHSGKLLILMNGFYRLDDKTRKRKSATRGLPPVQDERTTEESITWEDIIEALNEKQEFTYAFTRFITHSMAIHFPRVYAGSRLTFARDTKTLRPFAGTRRIFDQNSLFDWEKEHAMSRPIRFPTTELSYPSSLPFASVQVEEDEE